MHHARQKTEERAGEEKGKRRQLFMRNDKMNLNMRNVSPSRCLFLSHNKCKKGQKLKLIKINESHTSDRRENTGSRGGQRCSCRKVRGMERGGLFFAAFEPHFIHLRFIHVVAVAFAVRSILLQQNMSKLVSSVCH